MFLFVGQKCLPSDKRAQLELLAVLVGVVVGIDAEQGTPNLNPRPRAVDKAGESCNTSLCIPNLDS
jgi:hypothetical protein